MSFKSQRLRLRLLVSALLLDAVFGIALTTIMDFEPSKHTGGQSIVLVIHILLAIGLVLGGILQVISAFKSRKLRFAASVALLSTISALAAGGKAADNGSDTAVFIMAVAFLIALAIYIYSLVQVSVLLASKPSKAR